jgi:hypothetical protein
VIKKYEKQLKETNLWDKLTTIPPEVLESALIRLQLKDKTYNEVLKDLNRVFEVGIAESELTEDEDEKMLFEAWKSVESGEKSLDEVEKEISIEKEMEET